MGAGRAKRREQVNSPPKKNYMILFKTHASAFMKMAQPFSY
ncbi:MAG: hypothetical protein A4E42_00481 [Methanoregulaceae archaeon PtaU1.Bin222]|nr:MAG: hypothetical protein A4E42_00481 [Methanoregulaceae archaeon PtaU1.Bin222]